MGTVTGYTAAKMKEIADAAIDSVEVVGDDLIIHHADGSTTNAGNVRGFPGISDMALYDPPGVPKPYAFSTLPTGYGWCDAATEYDGTTYPLMAAEWGTGVGCIHGASTTGKFRLPNYKGRVLVGRDPAVTAFDTLHEAGGSKNAIVVDHNHEHSHSGTTSSGGDPHTHEFDHTHGVNASTGTGDQIALTDGVAAVQTGGDHPAITGYSGGTTAPSPDATTGGASDSSHTHSMTTSTDYTSAGSPGTDANLQPYRVVNYIMRLA